MVDQKEIKENNKLVADFMCMRLETSIYFGDTDYEWRSSDKLPLPSWCFESPPPFNQSWNWLMPVIKRIKEIQGDDIEIQKRYSILMDFLSTMDFDMIYNLGVVEFIKWYNSYGK